MKGGWEFNDFLIGPKGSESKRIEVDLMTVGRIETSKETEIGTNINQTNDKENEGPKDGSIGLVVSANSDKSINSVKLIGSKESDDPFSLYTYNQENRESKQGKRSSKLGKN